MPINTLQHTFFEKKDNYMKSIVLQNDKLAVFCNEYWM